MYLSLNSSLLFFHRVHALIGSLSLLCLSHLPGGSILLPQLLLTFTILLPLYVTYDHLLKTSFLFGEIVTVPHTAEDL